VIVATNEQVEMAPTLAEALGAIVGDDSITEDTRPVPTGDGGEQVEQPVTRLPSGVAPSLAQEALETYQRAQDALAEGDWATYGAEQEALEAILIEIVEEAGGVPPAPAATPVPSLR